MKIAIYGNHKSALRLANILSIYDLYIIDMYAWFDRDTNNRIEPEIELIKNQTNWDKHIILPTDRYINDTMPYMKDYYIICIGDGKADLNISNSILGIIKAVFYIDTLIWKERYSW